MTNTIKKIHTTMEAYKKWLKINKIKKGEMLQFSCTDTLFIVQRVSPNFTFTYEWNKSKKKHHD